MVPTDHDFERLLVDPLPDRWLISCEDKNAAGGAIEEDGWEGRLPTESKAYDDVTVEAPTEEVRATGDDVSDSKPEKARRHQMKEKSRKTEKPPKDKRKTPTKAPLTGVETEHTEEYGVETASLLDKQPSTESVSSVSKEGETVRIIKAEKPSHTKKTSHTKASPTQQARLKTKAFDIEKSLSELSVEEIESVLKPTGDKKKFAGIASIPLPLTSHLERPKRGQEWTASLLKFTPRQQSAKP